MANSHCTLEEISGQTRLCIFQRSYTHNRPDYSTYTYLYNVCCYATKLTSDPKLAGQPSSAFCVFYDEWLRQLLTQNHFGCPTCQSKGVGQREQTAGLGSRADAREDRFLGALSQSLGRTGRTLLSRPRHPSLGMERGLGIREGAQERGREVGAAGLLDDCNNNGRGDNGE